MKHFALWDVLAGLLAMAVALGVSELLTGAVGGVSLVVSVGDYVIDHSPGRAAKTAIELFGKNDKKALVVAIVTVSLALGVAAGALGRRRFAAGAAVIVVLGVAGALAGIDAPLSSGTDAVITAAFSTVAGVIALYILLQAAEVGVAAEAAEVAPEDLGASRRRFLQLSAGAVGVAVASLFTGRWVFGPAVDVEAQRAAVRLPTPNPSDVETPDPAAAALTLAGISPLITPNEDFYRIDTALSVPRVEFDPASSNDSSEGTPTSPTVNDGGWRLRVTGLVDNPLELTYQELLDMGVRDETVTLCCVSNEVGGDLISNATWTGVPLAALLERAGIRPEGTQIIARSVDKFTTGFRTDVALDGRPAMVAVAMNGEVLPALHGFPARMIVPGLYGYVSATKWLEEIEVTTWDGFDAYWITRGWAKEGPIKTQSKIEVPAHGGTVEVGKLELGGVAWGGIRSVSKVEVRFGEEKAAKAAFGDNWNREMDPDYGEWHEARLSDVLSSSSWRQWAVDWDAKPGYYRVDVRATDGLGDAQTHLKRRPSPDGATGYHGFMITVREG